MLEMMQALRPKSNLPSTLLGEVPSSNFISGVDLAAAIGLTIGTSINPNTPWLHFSYKNKELYVPKLPFRNNISWISLYNLGAIHGDDSIGIKADARPSVLQNARVTIFGKTYRVRLLRGSNENPITTSLTAIDSPHFVGAEWSDLFYPIVTQVYPNYPDKIVTPYSTSQVLTVSPASLCQEVELSNKDISQSRAVTTANRQAVATQYANAGWRPCLELIE